MISAEELVGEDWAEWYRLTPAQRWTETSRYWQTYLALGGSLDPEPDTQSPFFDMRQHQVQCLLMGGQACVLYGAAEFSHDTDLAILASEENAERITKAMQAREAEVIAVPPLLLQHLDAGHDIWLNYSEFIFSLAYA